MAQYIDYYSVLGVPKTATEAEIKSAYRKQAMKYHPDRNPGNKQAEAKFKELNEANEVLSDKQKRQTYDHFGKESAQGPRYNPPPGAGGYGQRPGGFGHSQQNFGGGFEQFGDFSEFFRSMFGGEGNAGFQGAQSYDFGGEEDAHPSQGDMESELHLTLSDIFKNPQQTLTFNYKSSCAECGGRGRIKNRACHACGGEGQKMETKEIRVNLPNGIRSGTRIRLKGQGRRLSNGRTGDLYLKIHIDSSPDYIISGDDIESHVRIMPWDAALGAEVVIPAPDGTLKIKLPAGTRTGKRLRVSGRGMPKSSGTRGDLYAVITIDIPETITPHQAELFKKLRDTKK